jgi:hypothetical protein
MKHMKIPEEVKLVAVEPEDRNLLKKEIKRECLRKYKEGITCHGMPQRLSSYKKFHIAGTKIYDNISLGA